VFSWARDRHRCRKAASTSSGRTSPFALAAADPGVRHGQGSLG
jgi:hypothetical protein